MGIAGLGVSTGQALGNSPAPGLGIDNGALGLTPSAQTQTELGVTTSAVSETPIGATPEVNSTPIGCGGACTTPGTAFSLGISAGLAAMLGAEGGANLTVTFACSCVQDISVSFSATSLVGYSPPGVSPTFSVAPASASQYNSPAVFSGSTQVAVNLGGQQITADNTGITSVQFSMPSPSATAGVQHTANFSLTNIFSPVTEAIGGFFTSGVNAMLGKVGRR